jgi:hypothetical protein
MTDPLLVKSKAIWLSPPPGLLHRGAGGIDEARGRVRADFDAVSLGEIDAAAFLIGEAGDVGTGVADLKIAGYADCSGIQPLRRAAEGQAGDTDGAAGGGDERTRAVEGGDVEHVGPRQCQSVAAEVDRTGFRNVEAACVTQVFVEPDEGAVADAEGRDPDLRAAADRVVAAVDQELTGADNVTGKAVGEARERYRPGFDDNSAAVDHLDN